MNRTSSNIAALYLSITLQSGKGKGKGKGMEMSKVGIMGDDENESISSNEATNQ